MSGLAQFFSSPEGRKRVQGFLLTLIFILVTFFLIEILPLHFGPRQIPWEQLGPEIKQRLPRIILIGVFAAAFISAPGRKKAKGGSEDRKDA